MFSVNKDMLIIKVTSNFNNIKVGFIHLAHSLWILLCLDGTSALLKLLLLLSSISLFSICLILSFFNTYLFFGKTASGGGVERGKQRIWSRLCTDRLTAVSLMGGSNSLTAVSRPEPKVRCATNWATQVPHDFLDIFLFNLFTPSFSLSLFDMPYEDSWFLMDLEREI